MQRTWQALYRSSTIPGISLITGDRGRTREGHCTQRGWGRWQQHWLAAAVAAAGGGGSSSTAARAMCAAASAIPVPHPLRLEGVLRLPHAVREQVIQVGGAAVGCHHVSDMLPGGAQLLGARCQRRGRRLSGRWPRSRRPSVCPGSGGRSTVHGWPPVIARSRAAMQGVRQMGTPPSNVHSCQKMAPQP